MSMEFLYLKNQLKLFYFARRDQSDMRNMKLNTATQFSGHYAKIMDYRSLLTNQKQVFQRHTQIRSSDMRLTMYSHNYFMK